MHTECAAAASTLGGRAPANRAKNSCGATTRWSSGSPPSRGQLVGDHRRRAGRLGEVFGDLAHEHVAVLADVHPGHHGPHHGKAAVVRGSRVPLASAPIAPASPSSPRCTTRRSARSSPASTACAARRSPDWEWCVVDDCSTRPEVRRRARPPGDDRRAHPRRAPVGQRRDRRRDERRRWRWPPASSSPCSTTTTG